MTLSKKDKWQQQSKQQANVGQVFIFKKCKTKQTTGKSISSVSNSQKMQNESNNRQK